MALVPASINLTFNANYTGCHRACWRLVGAVNFDCTTQVICAGGGAPCSVTISVMVDDSGCVPVSFEGYVQACCEDPLSLVGRLPFTVTFVPNPNCKGYTIHCDGPVSVLSVYIVNPGTLYAPGTTIPVTFTGGGGSGAVANALIGDGGILTDTITTPGAGYLNGTYTNIPAVTVTGIGSGAIFDVVIAGGVVTSTTIVAGSNGITYAIGNQITFLAVNLGGAGAGVVCTVATINTGTVQSVTLSNPGSGYSTIPTATLPPSGGTQAVLFVVMNLCPLIDITNLTACGQAPVTINGVPLDTGFVGCFISSPILNPAYSVTQNSCCDNCITITIDKPQNNTNAKLYYTDCATHQLIKVTLTPGTTIGPICVVNNSWLVQELNTVTGITNITAGAVCP